MRSLVPVALGALLAGCTVTGTADEPFSPAGDDAGEDALGSGDASDDAAEGGPSESGAFDSESSDVIAETHAETAAKDSTPTEAAPDAPGDSLATLCVGFTSSPFEPPTKCDASSGNTTTQIPPNHIYSSSWFGCYLKSDGSIYKDPSDNCEFSCGNKGLCAAGATGPECEASLKWFAADADRYGCGGRIRVTNCINGKQVVLVTLDRGPNCGTVEQPAGAPVLDMSHPAMTYLFDGKTYGGPDHKRLIVEKVASGTPLGPVM